MKLLAALALAVTAWSCERRPAAAAASPAPASGPVRSATQEKSGWYTYHGGFNLDGVSDTALPDAPEQLWKYKAAGAVTATPVMAEGRIYFSSAKGGLTALDAAGREVWKISIAPDSFTSPPLLSDGLIVLGTGKGVLRAYEAGSGKEKWSYDVGGSVQGSPNRIELPDGKKGVVAISQGDGALHGVDLATGQGLWKMPAVERCDGSAGA
ncbi:MAG: PQQ-like beta-propeller repeat protein, partial [Planctomycetaceae bacterium]|nr:PQQ-like beta-propeller repeat protein [Planctomycetaceae bacterium]